MTRPQLTLVAGSLTLAFVIAMLGALLLVSAAGAATPGNPTIESAAKKCKVTQRRSAKGKCVRKKCRKGYKLNKRGRCIKIKCRKGYKLNRRYKCVKLPAITNPVLDRSDIDGDGLPLWRERALGSNPSRKSIFVQFNYSSELVKATLPCEQFDAVVNAFALAPVANPDGSQGIDLHIDGGRTCPTRSYDLGGSQIYTPSDPGCPGVGDGMLNGSGIAEDRIGVFHTAAINPTCAWGGDGGAADSPGTKMVVFTSGSGFAQPFMHELGHNLGLDHGPSNPNRRSVMNSRLYESNTGNDSGTEVLDYQRYDLPALDETNLSEPAGVGLPPVAQKLYLRHYCSSVSSTMTAWLGFSAGGIDWDCDADEFFETPVIDAGPVAADINGDSNQTVLPATPNEWNTITFTAGGKIVP